MDDLSGLLETALEIWISKLQKRVPYEQQPELKAQPWTTWQAALLKPVLAHPQSKVRILTLLKMHFTPVRCSRLTDHHGKSVAKKSIFVLLDQRLQTEHLCLYVAPKHTSRIHFLLLLKNKMAPSLDSSFPVYSIHFLKVSIPGYIWA